MELKTFGFESYINQLNKLTEKSTYHTKRALWEGARVVADEVKRSLDDIPVQNDYVPKSQKRSGLTSEQKEGVKKGFGIARMKTRSGAIDTVIGFDGETDGVKNATLMRRIESGTSFMTKHPVIRPAVNRAADKAVQAMQERFEEDIQEIMK